MTSRVPAAHLISQSLRDAPIELLTFGRRSGKQRATMLSVPIIVGDRLVLVASFGDDDRHLAWYLDLRSSPEVRVTIADLTHNMIARIATEE